MAEIYYLNWDDEDADSFERAGELFHEFHFLDSDTFEYVENELRGNFDDLYREIGPTEKEYRGEDDLERLWMDLQAGVGGYTDPVLYEERERSMSVGDVVELDDGGGRYVARSLGFSEL